MNCLSVQQPWCCAIVMGFKDVENRIWKGAPRYRGPLLLHAGKGLDKHGMSSILEIDSVAHRQIWDLLRDLHPSMSRGAIVGGAVLVGTTRTHRSKWAAPGQLQLVFEHPLVLSVPVPYLGQLGIFDVLPAVFEGRPAYGEIRDWWNEYGRHE